MGVSTITDGKTCQLHSDLYAPLNWLAQTTIMLHFGDPYATRSNVPEDIRGKMHCLKILMFHFHTNSWVAQSCED